MLRDQRQKSAALRWRAVESRNKKENSANGEKNFERIALRCRGVEKRAKVDFCEGALENSPPKAKRATENHTSAFNNERCFKRDGFSSRSRISRNRRTCIRRSTFRDYAVQRESPGDRVT